MIIVQLAIQLVILVVAMVIAGLIMRWIISNPGKCTAAWIRMRRRITTPFVMIRAFHDYQNWRRVGMGFTFHDCLDREWKRYDQEHVPQQPYYRQ